jgi:hypothetical protein
MYIWDLKFKISKKIGKIWSVSPYTNGARETRLQGSNHIYWRVTKTLASVDLGSYTWGLHVIEYNL